jgi:hypothetical protein
MESHLKIKVTLLSLEKKGEGVKHGSKGTVAPV